MTKTQPLLGLFNSQPAVFAGVCLSVRKSGCEAAWHRRIHTKSIRVDLNLHPLAVVSLTKRYALRCSGALQSP